MFIRSISKYCKDQSLSISKFRHYYQVYDGDIWLGSYTKKDFKRVFGKYVTDYINREIYLNFTQFILQQQPNWLFRHILRKRGSFKFEHVVDVNVDGEYPKTIYSYGNCHIVLNQRYNTYVLMYYKNAIGRNIINDGIVICDMDKTNSELDLLHRFTKILVVSDVVNTLLYALYDQGLIPTSSLHDYYDINRRLNNLLYSDYNLTKK